MSLIDQENFVEELKAFIWTFKVGDNILYNVDTVNLLWELRDELLREEHNHLNKPITILLVSIVEAVLYDFVCRLEQGTNHFPPNISSEDRKLIKQKLKEEKVAWEGKDQMGELRQYMKIKNYPMSALIKLFKKFKLFGASNSSIYDLLESANFLRNRIHIYNWHNNFERDESRTFTESRILKIKELLDEIMLILSTKYPR